MTEICCECAQRLRPVDTVENPCGKPPNGSAGFPPHAPPFQKPISLSDDAALWPAVLDALELLSARIDALEARLVSLIAIRQLKKEYGGEEHDAQAEA